MTGATDTTKYNAPAGGWDPNSLEDYFKSKGMTWDPKNVANTFEKQGLGSASSYTSMGKNNSAANMALLAKLKGYSGSTGSGISGSPSVSKGLQTKNALGSASTSLTGDTKTDTTATDTTATQTQGAPATGPTADIAVMQKTADDQISGLTTQYTESYTNLQDQKTKALSSAKQQYERAGGIVGSTGESQYLGDVSKYYDTQMNNLTNDFNTQKLNVQDTLATNVQNVKNQYVSAASSNFKDYLAGLKEGDGTMPPATEIMDAIGTAMAAGKTFEQAKSEISGALGYATRVQNKADLAESHQAFMEQHTLNMEALSEQRLADLESGKNQKITATDIKQYQADYPKAGIKIGDSADAIMQKIDAAPKFQFLPGAGKIGAFGMSKEEKALDSAGILPEDVKNIQGYLDKGATPDDIVAAIKGITPEQEQAIRNSLEPITE